MNNLVKRILIAAGGLVLVLTWWTIEGKFSSSGASTATSDKIPAKVWEGGGAQVTIEIDSSDPVTVRAFFASTDKPSGTPVRSLDTYEKISAGKHSWNIDVPESVGGNLEIEASAPKPGSRLSWTVRAGDKVITQESETLNEPLKSNEAFFLNVDVDEFVKGS